MIACESSTVSGSVYLQSIVIRACACAWLQHFEAYPANQGV